MKCPNCKISLSKKSFCDAELEKDLASGNINDVKKLDVYYAFYCGKCGRSGLVPKR